MSLNSLLLHDTQPGKADVAAEATSGGESYVKHTVTPADDPGGTRTLASRSHLLFDTAGGIDYVRET